MRIAARAAKRLFKGLRERGMTLATAESCTGGLIAKLITDLSGSSSCFAGGCVTYTNEVKMALLGVRAETIAEYTEVSHACAEEMAMGVRQKLGCDVGVSTTGYAGPGGGTEQDPVGTVYIGVAWEKGCFSYRLQAGQDRTRGQVRAAAAAKAMELVLELLEGNGASS